MHGTSENEGSVGVTSLKVIHFSGLEFRKVRVQSENEGLRDAMS